MKQYLFIIISIISYGSYGQQDPLYSQYLFNQGIINPAYSGIHNHTTATLISRHQWLGLTGAPQTNTFSAHSSFFKDRIGLGVLVVNDRLGVNSNNELSFAYAYKVRFRRSVLSLGLQGGMTSFKYDYTKLDFEFINDPAFLPSLETFSRANFGTGLLYASETFYFGVSIPRMRDVTVNDGVINSSRYKRHMYISSGYIFDRNRKVKFKPSFLVRLVDGQDPSFDLNASILLNDELWVGVMARNLNSYGANIQFNFAGRLRLGYSFELPSSALISSTFGTHEFMVGIDIGNIKKQKQLQNLKVQDWVKLNSRYF